MYMDNVNMICILAVFYKKVIPESKVENYLVDLPIFNPPLPL